MDFFAVENEGEWAYVSGPNGKHWYVCNSSGCSRIGIHSGGNANNEYCRYKFVHGAIIVQQQQRRLTVRRGEAWVDAVSANKPESQLFEVIPWIPPPPQPVREVNTAYRLPRFNGQFRVRHIASGRWLAVTAQKWEDLHCVLEFKETGSVFLAESDGEWTRIVWKGNLVWFHLKSSCPSQLGLNEWTDKSSSFCQFTFRDGYIHDRQVSSRVMTVGTDGRTWGKEKTGSSDQQFELIAGDGTLVALKPNAPVPLALIFDGCSLDKLQ
jgi:hypothetical protein